MDKKRLFTSKMNLELKKGIMRCLIWSVALMQHGHGHWRHQMEAFEMWIWWRIVRISWLDKISNEEELAKVKEDRQITNIIQQKQHHWIGHILRHESLLLDIMEGRMKGRPSRGRSLIILKHTTILSLWVNSQPQFPNRIIRLLAQRTYIIKC